MSDSFCNRIGYSPPGFSVHGVFQARILEWLSFPPPGDLPRSGIKPESPALAGRVLTIRSHHFMGNRWGNSGNSVRIYFGGYAEGQGVRNLKFVGTS